MFSEILLRRKNKIYLFDKEEHLKTERNSGYVATINKNIENLGYTLSEELFNALCLYSKEELGRFYVELITALKNMKGANVVYHPMYPNFPEQVMKASDIELYINAIIHYWSLGTLLPVSQRNERLPLFDEGKVEVLWLGNLEDLDNIFINLVNSKTSLSQQDKNDIAWFLKNGNRALTLLPEKISHKENAAYICKLYTDCGCIGQDIRFRYLKTPTDVLRFATALSDGDISLTEDTHFRNFKRSERRILLRLLEACGSREIDMARHPMKWIRLGEKLHPGEKRMADQFPKSAKAFERLRNEKLRTANSGIEQAIDLGNWHTAINLLGHKPGEFARRLDYLLRKSGCPNEVINKFYEISTKISTPVLLQVREHFLHRNDLKEYRVFFPKGSLAKSYNIPNELPEVKIEYCKAIVGICESALISLYKERPYMGKVYLSEEFDHYVVPFSQRSASKTLKTIVRGSRIPISHEAKAVRGFIWWTNTDEGSWGEQRVDIDLSATIFDDHWEYIDHVSYTNLKSKKFKACHSGDITNGGSKNGNGVAEFLDVDINSLIVNGARYIVFQVYDFTGINFNNLPHAMFGWMERSDVNTGEIFEPKTVAQKMDLTTNTSSCVPVIFDCLRREFIWCDMSTNSHWDYGRNVENTLGATEAVCYATVNMQKPNLYDLIKLNVQARGILVDNKEDADLIFDIEEGITPFDTEVFMGEYL